MYEGEGRAPVQQGIMLRGTLHPLEIDFDVEMARDLRGRVTDFELRFGSATPRAMAIAAEFSQSMVDFGSGCAVATLNDAAVHARYDLLDRYPDCPEVVSAAFAIARAASVYEKRDHAGKDHVVANDALEMQLSGYFSRIELPLFDGRVRVRAEMEKDSAIRLRNLDFKVYGQKETALGALAAIALEAAAAALLTAGETPAAQEAAMKRVLKLPLPDEISLVMRAAEHIQTMTVPFEFKRITGLMAQAKPASAIPAREPDAIRWQDVSGTQDRNARQLVQEWRDAGCNKTCGLRTCVAPMGDMRGRVWLDAFSELASCGLAANPDYMDMLDDRMASCLAVRHRDNKDRALDLLGVVASSLNPQRSGPRVALAGNGGIALFRLKN